MSEIPLFPLSRVLFPGGRMPLKIFEPRYLDMVKRCMAEGSGFGIILIQEGNEALNHPEQQLPAIVHQGTYSTIVDFNQLANGMLGLLIEGQVKFVVRDYYERPDRLMMADVEFMDMETDQKLPENQEQLASILQTLMQHEHVARLNLSVDYQSAGDVGARLTEVLPCHEQAKQRLLEMKDPLARLNELEKIIVQLQEQAGQPN